MIRYLTNVEIDTQKWDACIQHSMPSLVYAYSWYLDLICEDWDALVLGDYEVVMPIPFIKKMGISLAIHPLFAQQLGIFSQNALQAEIVNEFLEAIPSKFRWVKINLNYRNHLPEGQVRKTNLVLDLMPDHDTLISNYEKSLSRGIRKSEKSSCALLEGIDLASLMALVEYQNKERNMGMSEKSMAKFKRLLMVCTEKGVLETIGMYSPVNHLCSLGVFLKDRQRIYYLFGASDAMGREYLGMGRILDHLIKKHAGKGYTLDFEGSEIEGVAKFFQKFNTTNSPYPVYIRKGFGPLNLWLTKKLG